jgi:hypothetical protein
MNNPETLAIKNEQSKNTGSLGHTRHSTQRQTTQKQKQNNKQNTALKS